ncbi:MAG TPA: Nif3-like dinuclear metal center hexameric protein, partial [Gemmatales bacterium]|nr:Nif3-like dinuclear metal center hexameric protein [Gemmatales bacterium]
DDVVTEAIDHDVSLIVSHHPVLFKPTQRITSTHDLTRLPWKLIRHGIAVYSAHTAYDSARNGINDQLAELIGLVDVQPITPATMPAQCKIIVFVPESHLHEVSQALFQAGAGIIGNYEQCSFRSEGLGTFWGNASSSPALGKAGQFETAEEFRLETICPACKINQALEALKLAHPYEEPAVDVIPLQTFHYRYVGIGRIGRLPIPLTPTSLAERCSNALKTSVILTGDSERAPISKVAITCGAGGSLLQAAQSAGADAFLTGEIRFHDELAAQAKNISIIAAGHYATERPGVERMAEQLQLLFPDCKVWASLAERNPAQWISPPV